ncbi:hypothetical protein [Bradyrhizobium sp. DASA03007]|uniref:hypothetical protein n=1 Tax=unclassified Bradyrhizobium TaxID=2631580 RepID=UPI003F70A742
MPLARFTTRNIGTALTALNTAVPAGSSYTVIGMSMCNTSPNPISVDLLLRETGPNDTYVLKSFTIPAGETLFPWGTLGKVAMIAGDQAFAKSSAAASLDVVMPYYQSGA